LQDSWVPRAARKGPLDKVLSAAVRGSVTLMNGLRNSS
jgi:hypothetical protein